MPGLPGNPRPCCLAEARIRLMPAGRLWTLEETRLLRELAASHPGPVIAAKLGRSTQAVRQRASLYAIPLIGRRWGPRRKVPA